MRHVTWKKTIDIDEMLLYIKHLPYGVYTAFSGARLNFNMHHKYMLDNNPHKVFNKLKYIG